MLKMLCDEDLPGIREPTRAMSKVDCTKHQIEVVNELHVLIYRRVCLDGNLSSPSPRHKRLLQGTLSWIIYYGNFLEQLLLLVPFPLFFDWLTLWILFIICYLTLRHVEHVYHSLLTRCQLHGTLIVLLIFIGWMKNILLTIDPSNYLRGGREISFVETIWEKYIFLIVSHALNQSPSYFADSLRICSCACSIERSILTHSSACDQSMAKHEQLCGVKVKSIVIWDPIIHIQSAGWCPQLLHLLVWIEHHI